MAETSTAAASKPPAKKPPAAAAAPAPAQAKRKVTLFHLDTRDAYIVAYYADEGRLFAEAAVYINGWVPQGTSCFTVAEGGMSVEFTRATDGRCFDNKILKNIMKNKYSDDASRVTAYDEALQAMCRAKVNADGMGLYWGTPQVINFKEKVTGESKTLLYPYPSGHKVNGNRQYNTLATCRVELARQRNAVRGQAQVEVVDLFGIASSQESYDDRRPPPFSPPPQKRKRDARNKRPFSFGVGEDGYAGAGGVRGGYSEVREDCEYEDYDENGGGKRGY